ncbi:MAG: hypothetical protein Q9218_000395 [Villophora microphyllina]
MDGDQRLLEAFEAAHSVMLAILASPHNLDLTAAQLMPYAHALFQVFPRTLSPRQFRLAIKQLVRLASPPSPVQEQRPHLASTLLELVYCRLHAASSRPAASVLCNDAHGDHVQAMPEQAVLLLALIDSLMFLQIDLLAEWLPLAAQSIQLLHDPALSHICKQRLWEVLSDGEMDVERASFCVTWWSTEGRQLALYGKEKPTREPLMSGALSEISKL